MGANEIRIAPSKVSARLKKHIYFFSIDTTRRALCSTYAYFLVFQSTPKSSFPRWALTESAFGTPEGAIFPQSIREHISRFVAIPRIICRCSHSKYPRDHGREACAPVDPVHLREGFEVRNEATDAGWKRVGYIR